MHVAIGDQPSKQRAIHDDEEVVFGRRRQRPDCSRNAPMVPSYFALAGKSMTQHISSSASRRVSLLAGEYPPLDQQCERV